MKRLAFLLLLAGCAAPPEHHASAPARPAPPQHAPIAPASAPSEAARIGRMPWTLQQPVQLGPRASERGMELAPLANREIEQPSDRSVDPLAPSLEPMLLPPERRYGATFGREHLRETGPDRPLDNIVPGARLIIPLEPTPPSR